MANTFELISSVTVGAGGAASIDFTSIPSTYTDLKLVYSLRTTAAAVNDSASIRFNSDSGANYSRKQLYGTGSAVGSDGGTSITYIQSSPINGNGAAANTFGNGESYIPNYTSTTAAKSVSNDGVQETNASTAYMSFVATLWSPATQAAITSISMTASGNFMQYSTAYLYGVKNA